MGISFLKEMVYEAVISNKTTNLIIGIIKTMTIDFSNIMKNLSVFSYHFTTVQVFISYKW